MFSEGSSTNFDGQTLNRICEKNSLHRLEELKVSKSEAISFSEVYALIQNCPNLRSIRDMDYWGGITKLVHDYTEKKPILFPKIILCRTLSPSFQQIWQLRNYIRDNNLAIDAGGEDDGVGGAAVAYNPRAGRARTNNLWARDSDSLRQHYSSQ